MNISTEPYTIKPTHFESMSGFIVRVAPFLWYWVRPNTPAWNKVGPFWTLRGARKGTRFLPTAPRPMRWGRLLRFILMP